jgi:hypothetical protein
MYFRPIFKAEKGAAMMAAPSVIITVFPSQSGLS